MGVEGGGAALLRLLPLPGYSDILIIVGAVHGAAFLAALLMYTVVTWSYRKGEREQVCLTAFSLRLSRVACMCVDLTAFAAAENYSPNPPAEFVGRLVSLLLYA